MNKYARAIFHFGVLHLYADFAPRFLWALHKKLHYLEDVELEIRGFRHVPEDGVVGGLLADLDLAQADVCIFSRFFQAWKVSAPIRIASRMLFAPTGIIINS